MKICRKKAPNYTSFQPILTKKKENCLKVQELSSSIKYWTNWRPQRAKKRLAIYSKLGQRKEADLPSLSQTNLLNLQVEWRRLHDNWRPRFVEVCLPFIYLYFVKIVGLNYSELVEVDHEIWINIVNRWNIHDNYE